MRRPAFAAAAVACVALAGSAMGGTGTHFYVPPPNGDAQHQIATLLSSGDPTGASALTALAGTSHAVWITGGTPDEARVLALKTSNRAAGKGQLPVFALYNIPGRDCSGYSAGGATDLASYEAWIDGVAAGLRGTSIVILEPDSLGLLPQADCTSDVFTDADRYSEVNYAVDTLTAAGARVYLDGTHGAWKGVGDMADRLIQAGVLRAQGFFVNVSNYRTTSESSTYGTWVADCIAVATTQTWGGDWAYGHPTWCSSQYSQATGYQLDWSAENIAAVDASFASLLGGATPTTHFVVDTSRNGQGPLGAEWCNPPGRGAGIQPTTDTGNPLADAFLWVKVPGESDGQCHLGDPAAGQWFPAQALELATLASPALK